MGTNDVAIAKRRSAGDFAGVNIAIVPFPALGDITIYLRLAWLFYLAGAKVTFYCKALHPAREYFKWLEVKPEGDGDLTALAQSFDLVVACFEKCYLFGTWAPDYAALSNVAYVTAKKITKDSGLDGRDVTVREKVFTGASRAFCLDSRAGKTMVEWVDNYTEEVFGLKPNMISSLLVCPRGNMKSDLVLIFPTTPQQKKNYWLTGFGLLARALQNRGWKVEFVCMPDEQDGIAAALPNYPVRSFPDIKALMDHVACASTIISNDSGGGHLGSMMGLTTFTITRRRENFVWRPGFNENNTVVYPWFRFKWIGKKYIWRPFVPIWCIVTNLGKRKQTEHDD